MICFYTLSLLVYLLIIYYIITTIYSHDDALMCHANTPMCIICLYRCHDVHLVRAGTGVCLWNQYVSDQPTSV
jgi:hypothetical protein